MLPKRVEKRAGNCAQAAYARGCTISRADNGTLLIELPKPESERYSLPALSPGHLPNYRSSAVPVGITPSGATAWLDLADERHAHLLSCGTTCSSQQGMVLGVDPLAGATTGISTNQWVWLACTDHPAIGPHAMGRHAPRYGVTTRTTTTITTAPGFSPRLPSSVVLLYVS